MTLLFSCSALCRSWNLTALPLLTHSPLPMSGPVILSDLVTSSIHSQLLLTTLNLLQKALLASFYSLVTGHFDLFSSVVTPYRKTTSQLSGIFNISLDTQNILGSLIFLKEI